MASWASSCHWLRRPSADAGSIDPVNQEEKTPSSPCNPSNGRGETRQHHRSVRNPAMGIHGWTGAYRSRRFRGHARLRPDIHRWWRDAAHRAQTCADPQVSAPIPAGWRTDVRVLRSLHLPGHRTGIHIRAIHRSEPHQLPVAFIAGTYDRRVLAQKRRGLARCRVSSS